jgi:para-nitrobenzyl esterase
MSHIPGTWIALDGLLSTAFGKVTMKSLSRILVFTVTIWIGVASAGDIFAADQVRIANGIIETTSTPSSGVRSFKGIPFAQPPVGELRWKEPQPVKNWTGVRNADPFGPRCMQWTSPGDDYWSRSKGMSEDCLYLNVWTPAQSVNERLPVLVYFFGGGLQNGDGSEPRYDGESMARQGIVVVTVNYRLNIFGFFAHPELTRESLHHVSGNYGLMDQNAALRWVQENITAFGGDPKRVTIAGESAGASSVSAQVASPLSKGLMAAAIGESGGIMRPVPPPLAEAEKSGMAFAARAGASSLAALRAMSTERLQEALVKNPTTRFAAIVDGYFLPKAPVEIYAAGEQAHVPLMVGANSEEAGAERVLGEGQPTRENFANAVRKLYGDTTKEVLQVYAASTPEEVLPAATDLASDRFMGYRVWKWAELHAKTGGGKPVYRYLYTHPQPDYLGMPGVGDAVTAHRGAVHSAEIQYVMGNLNLDRRYVWKLIDHRVSEIVQGYFANFIKTGNPNGFGLPNWPVYDGKFQRMRLNEAPRAETDSHRNRYLLLDSMEAKR